MHKKVHYSQKTKTYQVKIRISYKILYQGQTKLTTTHRDKSRTTYIDTWPIGEIGEDTATNSIRDKYKG